jgi:integrase
MRSLITNVLNENGFNADAIERQLDHQEGNQVRRAYLRSDFMDERRKMMQWFADWCESNTVASNIVHLKEVA